MIRLNYIVIEKKVGEDNWFVSEKTSIFASRIPCEVKTCVGNFMATDTNSIVIQGSGIQLAVSQGYGTTKYETTVNDLGVASFSDITTQYTIKINGVPYRWEQLFEESRNTLLMTRSTKKGEEEEEEDSDNNEAVATLCGLCISSMEVR